MIPNPFIKVDFHDSIPLSPHRGLRRHLGLSQVKGQTPSVTRILSLACYAMLDGYRSYGAIADWGRNYGPDIANALVRDVTFDEDRSQVRSGNIPQLMAALRNIAIGLLRGAGYTNIAKACRQMAAQPAKALALVGIECEN